MIDPENITTILFDLDGTLRYTKPDGNQLFREFVRDLGYPILPEAESIRWVHKYWADSTDLLDDSEKFGSGSLMFWENYSMRHLLALGLNEQNAINASPSVLDYMQNQRKSFEDHVPIEVYELLSELREKGYCLGLVTNRNDPIADMIEQLDFTDKFDFFLYAGEINSWKPDEKIFLEALRLANATSDQTVYIGDNYFADVVGSKKVGMTPIFIDPIGWMENPDCIVIQHIGNLKDIF